MNKKKKRLIILSTIICIIVLSVGSKAYNSNKIKQRAVEQCKILAEDNGLENVEVIVNSKWSGYEVYVVTIKCTNFDELSYDEMITVDDNISVSDLFINGYECNGCKYEVRSSSRSIYKDGKSIYDDYKHSDIHKSVNEERAVTDDDELAVCWTLAKDRVKSELKSPGSAKFPFSYGNEDVVITKCGDTYKVSSWVDAENSFGATLRSEFIVTMVKSGYGKDAKFTTQSCEIN